MALTEGRGKEIVLGAGNQRVVVREMTLPREAAGGGRNGAHQSFTLCEAGGK